VPFDVPEGWCWKRLGEIGTWQSGATPNRLNKEYFNGKIPWLKTGDLNDDFIYEIPESITHKALEETSVKLNPAGSVLIAMYGATIGKVGILTFPATTNQACCACIEYNGVEKMYLFYFLLSHKDEFIRLGGGGAQPNISKEKIINTYIPIPPIREQMRIVTEIEHWLSVIKTLEEDKSSIDSVINQIRSKVLSLAIHGKLVPQDPNDEPAIELLKRINPKFKSSDNRPCENLPKGWALMSLTECGIDVLNGYAFKSNNYVNSGIRVIRITNVQDGVIIDENPQYYPIEQKDEIAKFLLCENDLLMSLTGNVGRVGFLPATMLPAALNQRVACLRNNSTMIEQKYLFFYFLTDLFKKDCLNSAKGVAQLNISTEWLKQYFMKIPPYKEQKRIVAKIEELFAVLNDIEKSLEA